MCFEITFDSVTSVQAQIPHGKPGGSCGHGHSKVSRVHVERYSMRERRMSQGLDFRQHCIKDIQVYEKLTWTSPSTLSTLTKIVCPISKLTKGSSSAGREREII